MRISRVPRTTLFVLAVTLGPLLRAQESVAPTLAEPVRLLADGKPIEIGALSHIAHAGPWLGDFTGDGVRDLLVGDFPGYFWLFANTGTDKEPVFTSKGKLQAGGEDAKTPVY